VLLGGEKKAPGTGIKKQNQKWLDERGWEKKQQNAGVGAVVSKIWGGLLLGFGPLGRGNLAKNGELGRAAIKAPKKTKAHVFNGVSGIWPEKKRGGAVCGEKPKGGGAQNKSEIMMGGKNC